jgi:hypothetical protein
MYKDKVFIMGSPAYNRMQVLKDRLYTQRILGSTYLNKKYKMQNDLMKRLKASGEIQ